jgi:hypothetical protein
MTNSALIVPSHPPAATNATGPVFHEAPAPLLSIANPWFWFWLVVILLAIAALIYYFIRRARRKAAEVPPPPRIPPHVRARRLLEEALAFLAEPKEFTTRVSSALRQYLEERFEFRAPERTTEEFVYDLRKTTLVTADQKQRLAEFLEACDLIKFAKYEPTETELKQLRDAALRIVNETEPVIVPPAEGASAKPAISTGATPPPLPPALPTPPKP